MEITRSRFSRIIRFGLAAVIVVIIIGYSGYRSLPYLRGPSIKIFQPLNGSSLSSTTAVIIGRVERINALYLNGNAIQVDESGNIKETIVIFPGINIVSIDASDQFGRTTRLELRLLGTGELPKGRTDQKIKEP